MSKKSYEQATKEWIASMGADAWFGFDLDGTLAHYDHWAGPTHIGDPVPAMVAKVKELLKGGATVKVFTARASEPDPQTLAHIEVAVGDWTERHCGKRLQMTCKKDYNMVALYDDRAIQIVPNEGRRVDGLPL